ncbi:uncharacterized protein LOC127833732 [Dreissena polymorpha]|uniref:uncharacterized protein LOC127833732 n=1 Tax=Dreissena polymorpha TaxID=45954 RepID=UPI00226492FE|nr:uncharacterized protein LOC127833732 [Dreissena polymorpha]
MVVEIISFLCVLLSNEIQAEVDFETRLKTIEAALQKDDLRIIKLGGIVNQQQEMLKDQSLTIYELRNQLNIQTAKLNEQEGTIKKLKEISSSLLVTVRWLKNDFEKNKTRNNEIADTDMPRNVTESLMRTVAQSGSGCGTTNQKKRDNQDHNKHISSGWYTF